MTFELVKDEKWGYTLIVNGETLMECLEEQDAMRLSFGEILKLMKECGKEVE